MRGGFVVSKDEACELGMIARRHPAKAAAAAIADVRRYVNLVKQSKRGALQCQYCHQQTACSCEPCAVDLRGPVVTYGTKVEQRENADGEQQVRVVVDAAWCDDAIDASGSRIATLRSDWQRCERLTSSEIADFVEAAKR